MSERQTESPKGYRLEIALQKQEGSREETEDLIEVLRGTIGSETRLTTYDQAQQTLIVIDGFDELDMNKLDKLIRKVGEDVQVLITTRSPEQETAILGEQPRDVESSIKSVGKLAELLSEQEVVTAFEFAQFHAQVLYIEELYKRLFVSVYEEARRHLPKEDAEDIAHDIFVKMFIPIPHSRQLELRGGERSLIAALEAGLKGQEIIKKEVSYVTEGEPKPHLKTEFEQAIERSVGESIESIQKTSLAEVLENAEKRTGQGIRPLSMFPFTLFPFKGRGADLPYEQVLTKEELEDELDKALR